MGCTYTIRIDSKKGFDGLNETVNSYEALYDLILKNYSNLKGKDIDIVFSLESDREIKLKKIQDIKSEIKTTKNRQYNIQENEIYNTTEGSSYVDVHHIIEKGTRVLDGKHYVDQYNETTLKANKIIELRQQLASEGVKEEDLDLEADKKYNEFLKKNLATEEAGYALHTVINLYYKGYRTLDSLSRELNNLDPDKTKLLQDPEFLQKILDGLKGTSKKIFKSVNHEEDLGNGHTNDKLINFMSNFPLAVKMEGTESLLYGNIDLLVLDKDGNPHIFLFKTSSKFSVQQPEVVNKKRDYYLAFYRQMLAVKGIDVSKMTLNIVPMQIDINNDGIPTNVVFEDIQDRGLVVNKEGVNPLTYGVGKMYDDAKALIPNMFNPKHAKQTIKTDVQETMDKFFNNKSINKTREQMEIDYFISNKVQTSTDPNYTWEFEDKVSGGTVRIKESSNKKENSELYKKVVDYIKTRQLARAKTTNQIIGKLKRVITQNLQMHDLVSFSANTVGALNINLGKYTDGNWVPLDFNALEEFGIVAVQNKLTSQVDFIGLSSYSKMNEPINLGLGNTLLGSHEKDHIVPKNILKATNGNMELIKVLVAINTLCTDSELMNNLSIGEIKIINTNTGEAAYAQNDLLKQSFNSLCKTTEVENNLGKLNWISDFELLKNRFKSIIASAQNPQSLIPSLYSKFEKIDPFNERAAVKELVTIVKELEDKYSFLSPNWNKMIKEADNASKRNIVNLYLLLNQTIVQLSGGYYQSESMGVVGDLNKDNFLNGRLTATPDAIKDRNIANMTGIVRETFTVIRNNFSDYQEDLLHKVILPFQKAKGYSHTQNMILGNQVSLYRNLFRERDGKILSSMMFKNPYDPKESLTSEEREFLKEVLWRINQRRFSKELAGASKNSERAKALQKTDKWFWVPLVKGEFASKLTPEKIKDGIIEERREIVAGLKRTAERFKQNAEEVYTETDLKESNAATERYEMFNRFSRSEIDYESRQELLNTQNSNFWETNVENILLHYEYAFIRKEVLDRVLPIAKSIRLVTEAYGDLTKVDTKENVTYINNYLKQAAFNKTILSEEEKSFVGALSNARQMASFLMVAGNIVAPIRDTLMGMWKTIGVFVADTWGEGKGFTKKDYLEATKTMLTDNLMSMKGITVCEALNQRFGIANVDINVLAQRAKSGKTGICNFKDKLYWTATAGDYFNRMCILIAKMKHDGCYDACSYDQGFKYNWTKDKRFSEFAKNPNKDSTSPEFLKQQGLYVSMLREFNENGYDLKYGDPLPSPYTPLEITTIKTFADRMYGYYDHETRMQAEKTALGAIFLQFSTYLTANKAKWMLPKGQYNTFEKVQKKDENGKLLFWKIDKDVNDRPIYLPTTDDTGIPMMVQGETYMEGILWTLVDAYKDFKSLGVKGMFQNIRDIKVKQQNLKSLAYSIFIWGLLGWATRYLIELWKENRKADKSPYTIAKAFGDQGFSMFSKALLGSYTDFNILSAFGGDVISSEPPMIGMIMNMYKSTGSLIFGDGTLEKWLKTNVSAYRSISSFVEGVEKTIAATSNSIESGTL